jgi:hypothetical protein
MADVQTSNEGDGGAGQIDYTSASVREALHGSIEEIKARKTPAEEDAPRKKAEKKPDEREPGAEGRERGEDGKFKSKEPAVDKQLTDADTKTSQTSANPEATTSQQPAATTAHAAPSTWSKEKHALWASLPPEAQEYVQTRERQSQDGVQQLKNGYAQIDAAIHPYKDLIRSYGQDPGTTIRQLFEWNTALAGPHKEQVFAQLAQRFGVDLSRIAPQRQAAPGQQLQGAQDPFAPVFQQLQSWQQNIEAQLQQQTQQQQLREVKKAEAEIAAWSKDKPHFERVRPTMKELVGIDDQLVSSGQPSRFGIVRPDGSVDLDRAYKRAIALDDELAGQVAAEEQRKREAEIRAKAEAEAEAKAEAEAEKKAKEAEEAAGKKRAGASLKPRAAGGPIGRTGSPNSRGESVRDTLRRSLREASES